ncbi:MAG TPA: hypothetical protein VNQ77_00235 [Frankiaceae bacterium]|nr:hypothetical protein [Frankiaceae bacterium]
MAIVLSMTAPDRTSYEAVMDLLDLDDNPPSGLVVHTASQTADGVRVLDVWETQADLDTFFETRLGKAIAEVGMEPPPPDITETFNVYIP